MTGIDDQKPGRASRGLYTSKGNNWIERLPAIGAAARQRASRSMVRQLCSGHSLSRFDELRQREAAQTAIPLHSTWIKHDGEDLRTRPLFDRKHALRCTWAGNCIELANLCPAIVLLTPWSGHTVVAVFVKSAKRRKAPMSSTLSSTRSWFSADPTKSSVDALLFLPTRPLRPARKMIGSRSSGQTGGVGNRGARGRGGQAQPALPRRAVPSWPTRNGTWT